MRRLPRRSVCLHGCAKGGGLMAEPSTPGYEVSRFEVRQFMRALGLDPNEVESVRIVKARAVATLATGATIHIRIRETRT